MKTIRQAHDKATDQNKGQEWDACLPWCTKHLHNTLSESEACKRAQDNQKANQHQ